jgi:hypothetical protein
MEMSRRPCGSLYQQKLALTSPTSGGRSLADTGHGVVVVVVIINVIVVIIISVIIIIII